MGRGCKEAGLGWGGGGDVRRLDWGGEGEGM